MNDSDLLQRLTLNLRLLVRIGRGKKEIEREGGWERVKSV